MTHDYDFNYEMFSNEQDKFMYYCDQARLDLEYETEDEIDEEEIIELANKKIRRYELDDECWNEGEIAC